MAKYRKKPVVIEAWRWPEQNQESPEAQPKWLVDAFRRWPLTGGLQVMDARTDDARLAITTLTGVVLAIPGDWVMRGVKGELYPCKPDIFEATYEKV